MHNGRYILNDEHIPIPCEDLLEWGRWLENADLHIADTTVGNVRISTVFLGLDYSFGNGPPLLFETHVFGGQADGGTLRYPTWERALDEHRLLVREAEAALH